MSVVIDVIIPVYNEENSIGKVIAEIPKAWVRNILVCNNGSTDLTAEKASDAGAIVLDQPKKGYGNACLKGMEYIGSRALGNMEAGAMMPQQIFGNWLATTLIRWLYNYHFTDLGPFRAIRYKSLMDIAMQDKTFGWTVEMQVKAAKLKLKTCEVPVRYRKRIGVSKVSGTVKGTLLAGHKILWTIFKLI